MRILVRKFRSWKRAYWQRTQHTVASRHPFYEVVAKYLPEDEREAIVDIGAGYGGFAAYLGLKDRYENLYLLDGSSAAVEDLRREYGGAILYQAPAQLPFDDLSVGYVHCSHMVEHLYYAELYAFLREVDRVLKVGGIFAVSTPYLWRGFYSDLTHVKPYHPDVFVNYLCREMIQRSRIAISDRYAVLELVHSYKALGFEEWGSSLMTVDLAVQLLKKGFDLLRIRRYVAAGYTLVLRKDQDARPTRELGGEGPS